MFVPAQRCKVLIVVFDIPQLNEEVVRARYYQILLDTPTTSEDKAKRTEVLAFGIILAIGNALRMTFESTLHLSGLPVPHLHRAVIAC